MGLAPTIGPMRNEALEAAAGASAVAGAKSATTAVTTGLGTAVASVLSGINWVTVIGVAVTLLTAWMTWYFKREEDKRARLRDERDRADHEQRQRERDLRINLMLAGLPPDKLPRPESQLADLPEREVANG